jgi:hypothetical protein
MVYINIPYVVENNRIDKLLTKKQIQLLDINAEAKLNAYEAVYNLNPRGVNFESKDIAEAIMLQDILRKLGIPHMQSESSKY